MDLDLENAKGDAYARCASSFKDIKISDFSELKALANPPVLMKDLMVIFFKMIRGEELEWLEIRAGLKNIRYLDISLGIPPKVLIDKPKPYQL